MELRNEKNININIGTDIIQNSRIKNYINNKKFIDRVLGDKEKTIFYNLKKLNRKVEFLAGRFSAKESITKALSYKPNFNKINIINKTVQIDNNYLEKIKLILKIKKLEIKISISHEKKYTVSSCLAIFSY